MTGGRFQPIEGIYTDTLTDRKIRVYGVSKERHFSPVSHSGPEPLWVICEGDEGFFLLSYEDFFSRGKDGMPRMEFVAAISMHRVPPSKFLDAG